MFSSQDENINAQITVNKFYSHCDQQTILTWRNKTASLIEEIKKEIESVVESILCPSGKIISSKYFVSLE
jgi:hypothetical protein